MDTQQIIKDRFKQLPPDIQAAITSTDLAPKFESIAQKHNLHIDQNGALQTETILVMIGLESTDDYVDNVKKALEISRDEALAIAKDVNTEILDSIRESLRKIQEQQEEAPAGEPALAEQPRVINTVEPQGTEKQQMISSIENAGNFTVDKPHQTSSPQYNDTNINRDALLKHIEGAEPVVPLVDHLLTTPVSNPQVVEVKNVVEGKKSYTIDPYKEQI